VVDKDRHAPENFYSSSNHRSEVFYQGKWQPVHNQRMDGALVYDAASDAFFCRKLRDLQKGDMVVCGNDSIRIFPAEVERSRSEKSGAGFAFMTNTVSSERSIDTAVRQLAVEMQRLQANGGKTVIVCGPVVVHTGGADALASLVRNGYVQGFLGGNAIAVHDLELRFFGSSLGVDLKTGEVAEHGHSHHMRSINRINGYGSIQAAIEAGILKEGLMYEIIKKGVPYCLAGSIRDDGPLPETVNDMLEAQKQYAAIIEGADLIIMLSTMLHSIGVGNMTPSWVKTICIDINPAVVTKLTDRGSAQAIGIVSDVGFFLRALEEQLTTLA
jgi:lysine-ketoglutarate reductase/saccharopine dehydrogenase-like protein (TIGR00300 family)